VIGGRGRARRRQGSLSTAASLLAALVDRGLDPEQAILFVIDDGEGVAPKKKEREEAAQRHRKEQREKPKPRKARE
jgi:hypothetical protein